MNKKNMLNFIKIQANVAIYSASFISQCYSFAQ